MSEHILSVCLAGPGRFGRHLVEHLERLSTARVVYVYHPDPAKAFEFGSRGVSDLNHVLKDEAVDCFFVTTPPDQRGELLERIFARGRQHVFTEKPLTHSYEAAQRLLPFIKNPAFDRVVMVGHQQRRESRFRKAREIIESGQLGTIISASFNFSHGGAYHIGSSEWRWSLSRNPGGSLMNLGIHSIDTLHYLLGPVEWVYASIQNRTGETEAPDACSVLLELTSGATVFLNTHYIVPSENSCTVQGTTGTIYINRNTITLRTGRDKNRVPSQAMDVPIEPVDAIEAEIKEFFDVIGEGGRVETGFQEALNAMAVVEACLESSRAGKVVPMSRFDEYFRDGGPPR